MSYLGKADCHLCDREVDVSENRAGMAYYRCAACGAKLETKAARGNRALRASVRAFVDPDDAAADKPAVKSSDTPAEPARAEQKTEPRAARRAGFWSV
ncbi:conserved protein of unknown function [Burkholderia multivorans]